MGERLLEPSSAGGPCLIDVDYSEREPIKMKFPVPVLTQVQSHPYPLLFATISGAHLYGFPSPDSDYDLRGVHCLPLTELLGLRLGPETIDQSCVDQGVEVDLVTHEVKKFIGLMLKNNGYVMEQLLSPLVVATTPAHEQLKTLAPDCLTRHHAHHYLGFAARQWELFQKEPKPRIKPLLYVYRVLLTGIHLMQSGEVEANLLTLNEIFRIPYLPDLVDRKLTGPEQGTVEPNELPFHYAQYLHWRSRLEEAFVTSRLPEQATATDALHDLLLQLRQA